MRDTPTATQRTARLYRRLRKGDRLTARDIMALLGYRDISSVHRLMPLLEHEDPDLVRETMLDLTTDRPILVWYLQLSCKIHN